MVKRSPLALTLLVLSVLFVMPRSSRAADFYVAPNASANGNGSIGNPWKLQTALSQPSAVHAGDTIWLRGGTYTGWWMCDLNGTASNPIIVRQYPGERAKLDGGDSNQQPILYVRGSYVWFWGFEIMSSYPDRTSSQAGPWPTDVERGDGVASGPTHTYGVKLINLTIHDTRQGISAFSNWSDTEINGCLIYYNGWDGPDNGHGHGIYTQNQTGYKKILNNIMYHQFSTGIHAFGSDAAFLNNYHIEGNTFFQNGDISTYGQGRNLLLGGSCVINSPKVLNNAMYYPSGAAGTSDFDLGYTSGCTNATVTGNYIATNTYMPACDPVSMTGNSFYGLETGFTQSQYPSNTYYSSEPTGTKVIVRPNTYEAGRANITVFNWANQSMVAVDLTGVLGTGTAFEVRNASDFFGAPVLTGVYNGGSITLPMTNLSVAAPVGWAAPPPTGPEFNVFVLLPVTGAPGSTPTPTPPGSTPTPTRTPTPGGSLTTLRIEAESPVITAPMFSVNDGTAFGGKYVVSDTANSGTASWTFSVPSTGTYYVWCRVKATADIYDSFFVKMDSGAEDIYDVAQTYSQNWQWTRLNGRGGTLVPRTLNPRTFSLSAGSHTLKFRGREYWTRLDRVIVTSSASFVPTETP